MEIFKKGVCGDGKVIFNEWPVKRHEQIIPDLNTQFISQFASIYRGTRHYPVFVNEGTSGIHILFKIKFDVLDIRIPGPGRDKQPDAAWRPSSRPQNPLGNALAPLLPQQTNRDPFPSLVLRVGHSESISNLISIRDGMLSPQIAIHVFILRQYNRNQCSQFADSPIEGPPFGDCFWLSPCFGRLRPIFTGPLINWWCWLFNNHIQFLADSWQFLQSTGCLAAISAIRWLLGVETIRISIAIGNRS